jgi:hypothetical protein
MCQGKITSGVPQIFSSSSTNMAWGLPLQKKIGQSDLKSKRGISIKISLRANFKQTVCNSFSQLVTIRSQYLYKVV